MGADRIPKEEAPIPEAAGRTPEEVAVVGRIHPEVVAEAGHIHPEAVAEAGRIRPEVVVVDLKVIPAD